MSTLVHQPSCARLRHTDRRVRCSCGADRHDTAPPERCPACDCDLGSLTAWQTQVVTDGHLVHVATCSTDACRAQAHRLARSAIARGEGVRLVDPGEHKGMRVEDQLSYYGYAVTERGRCADGAGGDRPKPAKPPDDQSV